MNNFYKNYLNIYNGKIIPSFKYDPDIVMAIREIDGRIWNKARKQWEIPEENLNEAVEILKPFGFILSDEIKRKVEQYEQLLQKIDEIKKSDKKYPGVLPLYDFQHRGAMFMQEMDSALLADVPGLGKTIQTIAGTENDEQILIFCPASLKYNWKDEIEKWLPDAKVLVIDGDKSLRISQWFYTKKKEHKFKYVIANYELLLHDFETLSPHEWGTIVCDEATRIANPEAKTTKNLYKLKCKKRIALTGTPISNSPKDIFGIMQWLVPGYLGTFYQFKKKYLDLDFDGWGYSKIKGFKNLEVLSKKVERFMLRRTKEEVFTDFPPKIVENVVFELSKEERRLYTLIKEQVVQEIAKLGDLDTRSLAMAPVKMLRLKQTTGHPELVEVPNMESSKLNTLKELLEPIYASGEKIIIFTQFSEMLKILVKDLEKYNPYAIYGDVMSEQRMKTVKEFNDKEGGAVIVMTEAGAYGLNMQTASYVCHYDAPWSIAKLQQREDRAHRIGRNKPVTIYNLIAKNTIDEYVMKVLHKKQKVSVDILQDADRLEGMGISAEDIKEILRL